MKAEEKLWTEGIAKWFRETRVERRFSQEEIATELQIRRTAIIEIEQGKRKLSAYELVMACSLFGVSPTLNSDELLVVTPKDISNLAFRLERMPIRSREAVFRLARDLYKETRMSNFAAVKMIFLTQEENRSLRNGPPHLKVAAQAKTRRKGN